MLPKKSSSSRKSHPSRTFCKRLSDLKEEPIFSVTILEETDQEMEFKPIGNQLTVPQTVEVPSNQNVPTPIEICDTSDVSLEFQDSYLQFSFDYFLFILRCIKYRSLTIAIFILTITCLILSIRLWIDNYPFAAGYSFVAFILAMYFFFINYMVCLQRRPIQLNDDLRRQRDLLRQRWRTLRRNDIIVRTMELEPVRISIPSTSSGTEI